MAKTTKTQIRLDSLHERGFDASYIIRGGMIRIKCGQCEALAVNGIGTHEHGCPNAKRHECRECGSDYRESWMAAECCAPVEN